MTVTLSHNNDALSGLDTLEAFTFTNETGGYNDTTGKWEEVTSPPVSGIGSIQPVPIEELRERIEWEDGGAKIISAILIYTTANLIAAKNSDPASVGSSVLYKALDWKVISIDDYSNHGHIEAVAVRVDDQGDA